MLQVCFWATSKNKTCPSKQAYCSWLLTSHLWRQSLAQVLHIKELLVLNHVGFSFQDTTQPFPQHSRVVLHRATCWLFKKTPRWFLNTLKSYNSRFTNKFQLLCTPLAMQNSCKAGLSGFSQACGYLASPEYRKDGIFHLLIENITVLPGKAQADNTGTSLRSAARRDSGLNLLTRQGEGSPFSARQLYTWNLLRTHTSLKPRDNA